MTVLGLDIGSRTVEAVWLTDGQVVGSELAPSGHDPAVVAAAFVERGLHDALVATGYGRHSARERFGCEAITEIRAYALGAHALFPAARAVLDIGGQDTKVLSLGRGGRVLDFEMNDKCAAGTGKFLEVMADALGFGLEEMSRSALSAPEAVRISSMCTVFAESEVTGLVHKGADRGSIARGLHQSISNRVLGTVKRLGITGPLMFAGGVANNAAMVSLVRSGFDGEVLVPEDTQTVGALGAALSASRSRTASGPAR